MTSPPRSIRISACMRESHWSGMKISASRERPRVVRSRVMKNAPSGTVAFFFSDIEGSTRLWDEHPDSMRVALVRHDEILRSAFAQYGGLVFSTGGDGMAVREILKKYDPEVVRFFILRAHYRSPLNYSDAHLDDAKSALTRLYTALKNS